MSYHIYPIILILLVFFKGILPSVFAAKVVPGKSVALPLILYDDCGLTEATFHPTGFMGDASAIERDECWSADPHSGFSCIRNVYTASGMWCGIIWQSPANDWGDMPGGYDLRKAKKLTFWARGEQGDERIEIKFGVLDKTKPYPDSIKEKTKRIKLTSEWKQYTISITGNKKCVKTGFGWVIDGGDEDLTFYFDDIQYQ